MEKTTQSDMITKKMSPIYFVFPKRFMLTKIQKNKHSLKCLFLAPQLGLEPRTL